jgi:hypothetical protein
LSKERPTCVGAHGNAVDADTVSALEIRIEKGSRMDRKSDIHDQIESLEARIAAKKAELEVQGVLHGPEREAASEIEMRRAHIRSRLENSGSAHLASEMADDVEVLKRLFEQWVARTDRLSERR